MSFPLELVKVGEGSAREGMQTSTSRSSKVLPSPGRAGGSAARLCRVDRRVYNLQGNFEPSCYQGKIGSDVPPS